MIYIDSSVLLAQLLAEDTRPPETLWAQPLVTSRLAQYEVWRRIHRQDLATTHGAAAEELLSSLHMVELSSATLERALHPLPAHARTLDALHIASAHFLVSTGIELTLATYDTRMAEIAVALEIPLEPLAAREGA
jgi:uncharacterized protein